MTDDPNHLEDTQAFEDDVEDEDLEDERETERRGPERRGAERRGAAGRPAPARGSSGRKPGSPSEPVMGGPRRGGGAAPAARPKARGLSVDPSLRIRDRVSEAFVIGALVVFGAILVNALAFGHGGAFSATPTPVPSIAVSAAPSGSVGPSGSPAASPTEVPGPSTGSTPGPSAS
ncbi:MAG TPA: hypothetical protein VET90_00705 [Candidatus Binatus sp.]|nr:hypothetical protein [Candidatus Binatus sp.]